MVIKKRDRFLNSELCSDNRSYDCKGNDDKGYEEEWKYVIRRARDRRGGTQVKRKGRGIVF